MSMMGWIICGGASAILGLLFIWIFSSFLVPLLIWAALSAGFYWFYCRIHYVNGYTLKCHDTSCEHKTKITMAEWNKNQGI